jgi:excisionase family DNA binding protein
MDQGIIDMKVLAKKLDLLEMRIKELEDVNMKLLIKRLEKVECDQYVQKDVFTTEEACLFLDISPSQLYKLTSKQKIPHYKPRGKMVYFDKEELVKWLKRNHKNEVLVNDTE